MKPLNPTFSGASVTIFTIMSALANEHGAINLGQGFPDSDGPLALRQRAARALIEGPNQYPPMMGEPALRAALAAHAQRFYDLAYDSRDEVLVTSGGTEALTASIMGVVKPGDEVVLIEPAYDSYRPIVEAMGGVARPLRLAPPDWSLTEAALAAAFSDKTKAIILNSPMNPIGKVFARHELELIATYLNRFDAIAICDEVYEHLTFDDVKHTPLAALPGMRERSVRIGSAGKMFSFTGWKVGWVEGPRALIGAISRAHQFITFTTPNALQIAVAEGLETEESYLLGLARDLQARRDLLSARLEDIGFEPQPSQGTYFLTVSIRKLGFNGSDVDFCMHITEHAGVAAIPLSVFFTGDAPHHLVRFAFCKQRHILEEAAARLAAYFGKAS
ncbi:MAG: aminotransferase [Terricaulis silvestris]